MKIKNSAVLTQNIRMNIKCCFVTHDPQSMLHLLHRQSGSSECTSSLCFSSFNIITKIVYFVFIVKRRLHLEDYCYLSNVLSQTLKNFILIKILDSRFKLMPTLGDYVPIYLPKNLLHFICAAPAFRLINLLPNLNVS